MVTIGIFGRNWYVVVICFLLVLNIAWLLISQEQMTREANELDWFHATPLICRQVLI